MNAKAIVTPAVRLLVISVVCAFLLGFFSEITKGPIAAQEKKTSDEAMLAVLPEATEFELDEEAELSGNITAVNIGKDASGNVCGYVVSTAGSGFGGKVFIMAGFTVDNTLTGIRVVSHSETPGLGAKSTTEAFYGQYAGQTVLPLTVVKNVTPKDGEILAITSATITSNAVTSAVNEAYEWIAANGGAN